jgi:hypothetical protein
MNTPAKSNNRFRFCTLAGVEDVRLVAPNKIAGRFKPTLEEFYGPPNRRLIEDFLNWPSDVEGVLRFTRKYGPVQTSPAGGKEFEVFWQPWTLDQRRLRSLWRQKSFFDLNKRERSNGTLAFQSGWLTYTAANLFVYLCMDLVTCEAKRLKICKRADCPNPYFIARHLKQRFCSDKCAEWGQREWKKQWWTEHGAAWRQERKESKLKKKGGKNVTHKTR